MLAFAKRNVQMGLVRVPGGKYTYAAVRVFGCASADREEFRFHINQYKDFLDHLRANYIEEHLYSVEAKEVPDGVSEVFPVKEKWTPREHQVPVIEYLEADVPYRSKFIDMQTGKGKTFVALKASSTHGKRICIIVKAKYTEKWVEDVMKTYDVELNDIMLVRGSGPLKSLIQMGLDGTINTKIIVVGNQCMQDWYKMYELHGKYTHQMGFGCFPEDFFETIGAGMRIIDEVHESFHLNFKIDLYTNIEKSISLSATLINNDPFLEKMYKIAYPLSERYSGAELHRYIDSFSVHYLLHDENSVRTTEWGSTNYSHHALERSIIKNKDLRKNYFALIKTYVDIGFLRDYKKGQKCLIFCAGVDFCTAVADYIAKEYPQFDVRRYVEDDPYENLMEGEIVISTLQSAGTAHDIANLKTVILTVAVDSIQANVQSLGRLRELLDSNTYFYYFVCLHVPKHVEYGLRKEKMLKLRARSFQIVNAPFYV
jgi:superfamily II DNA or RNA helicase